MERRQKQLEQGFVDNSGNPKQGFWQVYIQNGARVMRHDGSLDSARRIVDNIITQSAPIYIQIQDEVHAGKDLSETAAGQAIKTELEKAAEKSKEELANLKVEMADALKSAKADSDRLKQNYERQMSSLEQRMNSESEARRKRTQEEVNEVRRQMESTLRVERDQQDRLRQQYQEEVSLMQQRARAENEEQKRLLESVNEKLRVEARERAKAAERKSGGICAIS